VDAETTIVSRQRLINTLFRGKQLQGALGLGSALTAMKSMGSALATIKSTVSDLAAMKSVIPQVSAETFELPELPPSPLVDIRSSADSLLDQVTELTRISSDSADYLVKMNETQAEIAGELKKSGDLNLEYAKANIEFAKANIRIAKFNIILGVLVLIATLAGVMMSFRSSNSVSRDESQLLRQNQLSLQDIAKTLKNIDQKTESASPLASIKPDPALKKEPIRKQK
jgi:hypothetical protein